MWSLATIATIVGVLLGLMASVTSLSMAVPVFTGQRTRDAIMLVFISLPVLQIAFVIAGTVQESAHPKMAMKLYVVTIVLLGVLLAVPALW